MKRISADFDPAFGVIDKTSHELFADSQLFFYHPADDLCASRFDAFGVERQDWKTDGTD